MARALCDQQDKELYINVILIFRSQLAFTTLQQAAEHIKAAINVRHHIPSAPTRPLMSAPLRTRAS